MVVLAALAVALSMQPRLADADSAIANISINITPGIAEQFIGLPIDESREINYEPFLGGQYIGKASVTATGWSLRIKTHAEHVDDGFVSNLNLIQAKANAIITDEFRLVWTGPTPAPSFPLKLVVSAELNGSISVDDFQESTFHLGSANIGGSLIDLDVIQNGQVTIDEQIELIIPVSAGAGEFNYSLSSDSNARNAGSESLNSLTTADLQLTISSIRADFWDRAFFNVGDQIGGFKIVGLGSVHLLPIDGVSDTFEVPLPTDFTMASSSGTTVYATDMDGNLILGAPRGSIEGAVFSELFPGFAPADVLDDPEEFFSDPTVRSVLATPLPPMASGAQSSMDLFRFDEAGVAHNFGTGQIDGLTELPTLDEVGWSLEFESGRPLPDAPTSVPGDYNENGIVDAADYALWRDTNGQSGDDLVADGNGDQIVDEQDYDIWRANFGAVAAPASGSNIPSRHSVPEPAAPPLLIIGSLVIAMCRDMDPIGWNKLRG
jgi:hypothetical protein